jgi:hypothetical protein
METRKMPPLGYITILIYVVLIIFFAGRCTYEKARADKAERQNTYIKDSLNRLKSEITTIENSLHQQRRIKDKEIIKLFSENERLKEKNIKSRLQQPSKIASN